MARSSVVPTLISVSANTCTHPKARDGRPVCHYESPEPGPEWPLAVWSCWWMAVNVNKPPLNLKPEADPELADISDIEPEQEHEVLPEISSRAEPPREAEPQPTDTSDAMVEPEQPAEPELDVLPEPQTQPEPDPQPEPEIEHGTVEGFKNGCQCRECRLAMRDQLKAWRKELARK